MSFQREPPDLILHHYSQQSLYLQISYQPGSVSWAAVPIPNKKIEHTFTYYVIITS